MKKILFIMMAVCGLTVSAQQSDAKELYLAAEKATTMDSKEIVEALKIQDEETYTKIKSILKEKNDILAQNSKLSEERKGVLVENTLERIKSILTEGQFKEFMLNERLYAKIKSTDLLSK